MLSFLYYFANHIPGHSCNTHFLGLKPWHAYLDKDPTTCEIQPHLNVKTGEAVQLDKLWLIALAILDDLLRVAGMVAVGFIIYGGIRYILSRGEPENTKAA